jgi:hypothetical protein
MRCHEASNEMYERNQKVSKGLALDHGVLTAPPQKRTPVRFCPMVARNGALLVSVGTKNKAAAKGQPLLHFIHTDIASTLAARLQTPDPVGCDMAV